MSNEVSHACNERNNQEIYRKCNKFDEFPFKITFNIVSLQKKKSIHKRKVKLIGWLETKEKGKEFYRTNLNYI